LNSLLKIIKLFPPEASHLVALYGLKILYKLNLIKIIFPKFKNQEIEFLGLKLANRLGTAAGLDKNGDFIDSVGSLGFGFLEVGTVTPKAQIGNPKPRVFRVFDEEAIINRLGFNNKGVDYLVTRLQKKKFQGIVGVNIGANKTSQGQKRIDDYIECFQKVYQYADYITVNISSPNTPGLRDLHNSDNLKKLIDSIDSQIYACKYTKPIFLKISPDEDTNSISEIIHIINNSSFSGLIASNTSIDKSLLSSKQFHECEGGLSGKPIMNKSTKLLSTIFKEDHTIPLIGVGGVMGYDDFIKKITAGASLVQIYSGFIVKGPQIVKDILKD
jgi:dihydroorotate dehydrogenase